MKIVSGFTKGIVSKLIKMVVRKKTGCNMNIQMNSLTTTVVDGKTHVHLDAELELDKEELLKLLKNVGLD